MIPPPKTRDSPITSRTNRRFTASGSEERSVHFASKSSMRPPASATKSSSRVRSLQKKSLPTRPAPRSRCLQWAHTHDSHTAPAPGDCSKGFEKTSAPAAVNEGGRNIQPDGGTLRDRRSEEHTS